MSRPRPTAVLRSVPVVVCDPDGATRYVSHAATSLLGHEASVEGGGFGDAVRPADRDAVAAAFVDATTLGTASVAFRTRRGAPRLEAALSSQTVDGEATVVLTLHDVTQRAALDSLLRDLSDPDRGVPAAESRRAVVRTVDECAARLPFVDVGWYVRDPETASLRPGTGSEGRRSVVPDPVAAAARTGRATPLDGDAFPNDAVPAGDAACGVAVPVGDRGVLVAGVHRRTDATPALLTVLLAVAVLVALAFDRLDGRRRARRFRAQRDRRETAYDRLATVVDVVRRTERRVVDAAAPDRVFETVCEGLTALDDVDFAWYGRTDVDAGGVVPVSSAGTGAAYLDALDAPVPDETPAGLAVDSRSTVHLADVSGGARSSGWRREALSHGLRTAFAVPVFCAGTVCGVVTVFGSTADSLHEDVRNGVAHLATTVGHALEGLELRSVALGNTSVELVISVPGDDAPLARVAAAVETPVTFESATPVSESTARLFFRAAAPPATVQRVVADLDAVSEVAAREDRGGEWLYEAVVTRRSLPMTVTSLGAVVTSVRADVDGVRATVVLPRTTDVRGFVDSVRESFPGAELLARRTRERPHEGTEDLQQTLDGRLTDRQREVLQTAYFGGYFEWPRERTGTEIAADLGITQPTFSRHLRSAQRSLLGLLLDRPD